MPLVSRGHALRGALAIRHAGTIGGSLAHADPAAELPAVMLALNATFTLQSAAGTREVRPRSTSSRACSRRRLEPGELLTEIVDPSSGAHGAGFAFDEVSRRHGDFALAGVAAARHAGR